MSAPHNDISAMIDAYIDGGLSAQERAEFDRRAATDPELAQELALQRRIDSRLRALMAAPDAPPIPAHAMSGVPEQAAPNAPIPTSVKPRGISPRLLRLAALLAICALAALAALTRPWAGWFGPERSDVAANVTYGELVKGGLKPIWVCGSEDEFKKYTHQKLGAPLIVTPKPGLDLVGWTYASGLLDSSAEILMCRADGNPVIVVMGKKSEDRRLYADVGSGIHIHRKQLGDVVMYELSKNDQPIVIDRVTPAP